MGVVPAAALRDFPINAIFGQRVPDEEDPVAPPKPVILMALEDHEHAP